MLLANISSYIWRYCAWVEDFFQASYLFVGLSANMKKTNASKNLINIFLLHSLANIFIVPFKV